MKTRTLLALFLCQLLALASDSQRMRELGKQKLDEVVTADGFLYFTGFLDNREIPTDFPTIYFHSSGSGPTLTILASKVRADFPIERITEALATYKDLVEAKAKRDAESQQRLLRQMRR